MLVTLIHYIAPLAEIDQHLATHREHLQTYYDQNVLIMSGPQIPRTGGIIIAATDRDTMQTIIEQDPFYQHQLATFDIIEFDPVKYQQQLASFLSSH